MNKKLRKLALTLAVGVLAMVGVFNANAFTVTITFDENGTGTFMNSTGANSPLPAAVGQDPGPGGLARVDWRLWRLPVAGNKPIDFIRPAPGRTVNKQPKGRIRNENYKRKHELE